MRPRLFGHPLHPMLVGLPIGLWCGGFAWDLVALVHPDPLWPRLAFWSLALGTLAALPTAGAGLWELATVEADAAAERVAWWHAGAAAVALCLIAASLLVRHAAGGGPAPWAAIVLAAAGVAATGLAGWLGGELVFRHGLAVAAKTATPPAAAEAMETD